MALTKPEPRREKRFVEREPGDERPRPTQAQVSTLAYELYLKRGGAHGEDWADWFKAEAMLKERISI